MNNEDKSLAKNAILVTLDNLVATVDVGFQTKYQTPIAPFGLVWGLLKALSASVIIRRANKAKEIITMVDENKEIFTPEVLSDEKFQDGFAYGVERYLIERNEEKRRYFRNIFLGFAIFEDKGKYHLEKLIHTLSQVDEEDILLLSKVDQTKIDNNYQLRGESVEHTFSLIHAGLILQKPPHMVGDGTIEPYINISDFGKEFIKYITKPEVEKLKE